MSKPTQSTKSEGKDSIDGWINWLGFGSKGDILQAKWNIDLETVTWDCLDDPGKKVEKMVEFKISPEDCNATPKVFFGVYECEALPGKETQFTMFYDPVKKRLSGAVIETSLAKFPLVISEITVDSKPDEED